MKKIIALIIILLVFLIGCVNPTGGISNSDNDSTTSTLDLDNISFTGNYVPRRILRDPVVRDDLLLASSGLYQISGDGQLTQLNENISETSWGRLIHGDLVVTGLGITYPADYKFRIDQGSDLASLSFQSETALPGRPWDFEIYSDHLYVTENGGGLLIYNISNPASPVLVNTVHVNNSVLYTNSEMEIYGNDLLITGELNSGEGVKLHSFDLTDPSSPLLNSSISVSGAGAGIWDMMLVGRNLLIPASDYASGNVGRGWLKFYSLADPANPTLIQNIEIPSVLYEPLALITPDVPSVDNPTVAVSYTQGYRVDLFEYMEHATNPAQDEIVLKEQLNPVYIKSQLCAVSTGLLATTWDGIFSYKLSETEYEDGFRQPSHFFFAGNATDVAVSGKGLLLNGHIFQSGLSSLDDSSWNRIEPTIQITDAEASYANGYLYIAANFYTHARGSSAPVRETGLAVYRVDSQGKPILPRTDFITSPINYLTIDNGWGYLSSKYLDLSDPAHPVMSTVFNSSQDDGSSCNGSYAAYVSRAMDNNRVYLYERTGDTSFTSRFNISLVGPMGTPVFYIAENGDSRLIVPIDNYNTSQLSLQVYKLDWVENTGHLLGSYTSNLIPSVTAANEYPQIILQNDSVIFGHRKGFEVVSITDNADGSVLLEQVKGFSIPGLSLALDDQSLFVAGRMAGFYQYK